MKRKKQLAPKANPKGPKDINQLAHFLVQESTREKEPEVTPAEVSRVMAALGSRGGKIGGRARAESLSGERRVEIALKAARARWDKKNRDHGDIEPLAARRVKSKV